MSGGNLKGFSVASTEILKKEGGTSWQTAASLPSSRGGLRGVSLPNGHFMVSGEDDCFLFNIVKLRQRVRQGMVTERS